MTLTPEQRKEMREWAQSSTLHTIPEQVLTLLDELERVEKMTGLHREYSKFQFERAERAEARVKELEEVLQHDSDWYDDTVAMKDRAEDRIAELEAALREVAKGEGPYSTDQLTHAENTIRAMKATARQALEEK